MELLKVRNRKPTKNIKDMNYEDSNSKIGECSKHPGRSMINCPACAIEEMKKNSDKIIRPSVHAIWKKCVEENRIEEFKEMLIDHGHIVPNEPSTKTCNECGHDLPISYFNDKSGSCYMCEK
jgi:hypothetical protein